MRPRKSFYRHKRVAESTNTTFFCGAQQSAEHSREHVGVLMGVKVRELDAGGLRFAHLGERFGGNLVSDQLAAQSATSEVGKPDAKVAANIIGEQRIARGQRLAVDQGH